LPATVWRGINGTVGTNVCMYGCSGS